MEKISIEEALEKDLTTAVDFEITLAALLSASLLIAPGVSDLLRYPTIVVALLLLALTLCRQMGIINALSRDRLILDKTSPILVVATTYASLYTTFWVGHMISAGLPVKPMTISLILAVLLPPVLVAIYEIFYRDFMLMCAIIAYNECVDMNDSPFRNRTIEVANSWLTESVLPREEQPSVIDQIRNATPATTSEMTLGSRIGSRVGVG